MERMDKLNQLKQFNRPWEYDCCDIAEKLVELSKFEDEYFRPRYSVVVRQFSGSVRGYIVSANGRHEVMKRLLEKLDFNYVAEVSIGEILVKEDEF